MADTGREMVPLAKWFYAGAQVLRCERLAESADVVSLTFDRKQRRFANRARVDAPAAIHDTHRERA